MSKALDPRSPSIVRTAGTAKGAPRVRGSDATVREIVLAFIAGDSVLRIALHLDLEEHEVNDAIRYHMNHPPPRRRPIRWT